MPSTRDYWILPDHGQTGDLVVIHGGMRRRLLDVIDVRSLPPQLVLGVPEGLLTAEPDEDVLYGEYVRREAGEPDLFAVSCPCGTDLDERMVHLTFLQEVMASDRPHIPPPPRELLSPGQAGVAARLRQRYCNPKDPWMKAVHEMLEAVEHSPGCRAFASVRVRALRFKPDWTPPKKVPVPAIALATLGAAILALTLVALFGEP